MPTGRSTDQWGNDVTAAGADAVRALDKTLMCNLALGRETGPLLKDALAADPDMVMAHSLKGYFFLLMASGPLRDRVPKVLAAAEACLEAATAREKTHVRALKHWLDGDTSGAVRAWEEILADHPRDVLALRLAHHAYFYMGAAGGMLASVERVLDAWDEGFAGYGFVLGMRAFALEESGDYAAAEEAGRRAVDINTDDPWAVHAVAHVMEMQDRHGEGIEWITGLQPHWQQANNFRYHLWWHRALMHLGRGEADEALRLYDESIWDPDSDEYLDLCNDVSLLLRLELLGVDIGDRWRVLAEKAGSRTEDRILTFIDCHVVAALAAAGQVDKAERMVEEMASAGGVFADVGATVSKALIAHRVGNYPAAARLLGDVRDTIVTIGGSHAQRNLFELLLEDAGDRRA